MIDHPQKNVNICQGAHFVYSGFTVMPGFIFGIATDGTLFVSNGRKCQNNNTPYFHAYLKCREGEKWFPLCIREENNSQIFHLILKGVKRRESKGIKVQYLKPKQLEAERWQKDEKHTFFPNTVPYKSSCHTPSKYASSEAKFKSTKEKNEMVQRLNTTYHNISEGNVMVI
mgnify:FL=1